MSISFLIYIAFGMLMLAYFYIIRTSPTYVYAIGLAKTNSIIGVIALAIEVSITGNLNLTSSILVGLAVGLPALFHSYALVFNFDREVFNQAVEDSAHKLLMEIPVWEQNNTSIKSRDAILHLYLRVPLPKVGTILYTYDELGSRKLELYKQLLAKHFNRAFPRIKINVK